MKHLLYLLFSISCCGILQAQSPKQINHLKAFAKAYGYVKYFHPSDEAVENDWNLFSIYGTEEVMACQDEDELVATLNRIFAPIAPAAKFSRSTHPISFDPSSITPPTLTDYKPVYWQHQGVSWGTNSSAGRFASPYRSRRVGKKVQEDQSAYYGVMNTRLKPKLLTEKKIKYSAWVKIKENSTGTGHLSLRVDCPQATTGFFDNMIDRPIKSNTWTRYEIVGFVEPCATAISLGAYLLGKGEMYVDDVQVSYEENGTWKAFERRDPGFEESEILSKRKEGEWSSTSAGYEIKVQDKVRHTGEKAVSILYQGKHKNLPETQLFSYAPNIGEIIEKEIGEGIMCHIPLVLYANETSTYPSATSDAGIDLQRRLQSMRPDVKATSTRIGNIINTYNVFQHFYPYFEVVEVNWEKELEKALERSFTDESAVDHVATLEKMTAALRDGHMFVSGPRGGTYVPPISWDWVENQLVITDVFDTSLDIQVGDVVEEINGDKPESFFQEIYSRISSPTPGWRNYIARGRSLYGPENSTLTLLVNGKRITLRREGNYKFTDRRKQEQEIVHTSLSEGIYYLNLDLIDWKTLRKLFPKLKKSQAIICDLRGYPNRNDALISHFLPMDDTTKSWMQVPRVVYPDQENIVEFKNYNWMKKARKPYLGDKKVIFIIDGRAISYAESYMGYIEGYDLATIVGQPTAGTNGNVNSFTLPGGFTVRFTGMKVVKHDGSQHHGIGILPDVYVEKTIQGIREGRDEFLEKAIELAKE